MLAPAFSRLTKPGLRPYLIVSSGLFVVMLGQTLNRIWPSPDFWFYLASVREFAARPLHPLHPLIVGSDADPYMGPYSFALGLITRVSGVDAVNLLAVAGLANFVVLLAGIWRFTRRFSAQALDRKSTRLNSSHSEISRMPSSA